MKNKNFDLILNFGETTFNTTAGLEKLNKFKFCLDCLSINYKSLKSDSILQFIFEDLNIFQYQNLKNLYYKNMYDANALYDINDVMFMSYNKIVDRLSRA